MTEVLWQLEQVNMATRLTDLSLGIGAGVTAVLGISGAGKTSLLNLLVDFEKPSSGKITFNPSQMSAKQLPVFWAPQDDGLWPHLTVLGHLRALAQRPTAQRWLSTLNLTSLAHKKPSQLSRGEQNRLAIARAMVSDARVLVMDEPLAHVASQDAFDYWQIIIDQLKTQKQSLVFATHDPTRVLAYADHVICLEQGRLLEQGPTSRLYQQPQHQQTADLLGPANWFGREESKYYLGQTVEHPRCVRPEQLQMTMQSQSDLTITSTQCHGSIQRSTLAHPHVPSKDLWHLPLSGLKVSDPVSLKVLPLMMLFLMVFLSACHRDENTLDMPVKKMAIWVVPVDDISVPASRSARMLGDGRMVVLDTAGRVLLYNAQGKVTDIWHMPTHKNGNPEGTCLLADGRIAVADTHYHRIVFFDMQGNVTQMFGQRGTEPGQFIYPVSITQDEQGFIYVVEYGGNDRVQKFTADMKYVLTLGRAGTQDGEFQRASGSLYLEKKLYVADAINNRILVFDTQTSKHVGTLGQSHLDLPYDITFDPQSRHFYIAEYGAGRITEMDLSGTIIATFGQTGRDLGQLMTPWALTVTSDSKLRIMDTGNRRIVELEF